MLAGSGHIAGVINPPARVKYQYWTNDKKRRRWKPGSRALRSLARGGHYAEWLAKLSGSKVPARVPGATLGAIEDAPGSFVKSRD